MKRFSGEYGERTAVDGVPKNLQHEKGPKIIALSATEKRKTWHWSTIELNHQTSQKGKTML